MFYEHKNVQLIIFPLFPKEQNLGCYNYTPLKMNLVLEIRLMLTQTNAGVLFLDPLLF